MQSKYSVFLSNVGTCSDRYCAEYAPPFSIAELFDRVASIENITGVDLVGTWNISEENAAEVAKCLKNSGLHLVSIAPDLFASPQYGKGSFTSPEPAARRASLDNIRKMMDITASLGCDVLTIWPGQDGYDYPFQANYAKEHDFFLDGIAKICSHNPKMRVALEYKQKEPRTHCYLNSVSTTLLYINEIGAGNLGVALDFGHALLGYENPAESVALLSRFGNKLFHVHINDNYRLWDDDMIVGSVRTIEYLEFFHWLERTGYDGWLTIDQFPYREDGRDAAAESAAWLDTLGEMAAGMDAEEINRVLTSKDAVGASRMLRRTIMRGVRREVLEEQVVG